MKFTKTQFFAIGLFLVLLFSLPVAIFLSQKRQDIRPRATDTCSQGTWRYCEYQGNPGCQLCYAQDTWGVCATQDYPANCSAPAPTSPPATAVPILLPSPTPTSCIPFPQCPGGGATLPDGSIVVCEVAPLPPGMTYCPSVPCVPLPVCKPGMVCLQYMPPLPPGGYYCGNPTPTPTQDNQCINQPDGSSCTISDCPYTCPTPYPGGPEVACPAAPCNAALGKCMNQKCNISSPPNPPPGCFYETACTASIPPNCQTKLTCPGGTPTPPVGCKYQDVQCFQAPCEPVLICNVTPLPITPAPGCSLKKLGDTNCDGIIDGIDYVMWLNRQCRPGPNQKCADLSGDFNNDGKVDDDDYKLWFANRNNRGGLR